MFKEMAIPDFNKEELISLNLMFSNRINMDNAEIKREIHEYIDNEADDRLVNLIYAMIIAETTPHDYSLTQAQKDELDGRIERHKNGESKSHTWEEVKAEMKKRL
jgi:putative addiction module component (TIGR02574 family)